MSTNPTTGRFTESRTTTVVGTIDTPAVHPRSATPGESVPTVQSFEFHDNHTQNFSAIPDHQGCPLFQTLDDSVGTGAGQEGDVLIGPESEEPGAPFRVMADAASGGVTVPGLRRTTKPVTCELIEEPLETGVSFAELVACPQAFLTPQGPLLPDPVPQQDGTVKLVANQTTTCTTSAVPPATATETVTVSTDLIGRPAPPSTESVRLTVVPGAIGSGRGRITGSGGLDCGSGAIVCSHSFPVGTAVRLAALPTATSLLGHWEGCDEALSQQCTLTMTGSRTVSAVFVYDFVGQSEPPSDDLFDPDRKIELADAGAEAAKKGAIGCGATAAVVGTAAAGGVILGVGAVGAGAGLSEFGGKLIQETLQNCAEGFLGTIYNGVLLKVDPPDPDWRRAAYAERIAPEKVTTRCKLRQGCKRLTQARKALAAANARVAELQEALAVAANRYGNAVGFKDQRGKLLHRASMRAYSGMLADAIVLRDRRGAELARAIRAAGIKKLVLTKKGARRALAVRAKGGGVPAATTARLLRKHLITSAAAAKAQLRAEARRTKPAMVDVLALLRRPTKVTRMRADAARLTVADLHLLVDA